MSIQKRKAEHIKVVLEKENIVDMHGNDFNDIILVHQSLPEISYDDIDTSVNFLGKNLDLPILINAMTGGTNEAEKINKALARAAEKKNIAFAVGSQRAMIENANLKRTFYVRDVAPNILLLGNIGIAQLRQLGSEKIIDAVESIGADGVEVHINPGQEIFQDKGDKDFSNCIEALADLCKKSRYPVIGKEVGNGFSRESAFKLKNAGVSAIDVGGYGGTNWLVVDAYRAGKDYSLFTDWGIPTPISVMECKIGLPLIATGGIRNGLDIAKSIVLGADIAGSVSPFLKAVKKGGEKAVIDLIESMEKQLKIAMFITGSKSLKDLRNAKHVLIGKTKDWAEQRNLI